MSTQLVPYPSALNAFPVLRQSTLSTFDECGLASRFEREYRHFFSDAAAGRGIIWHRAAGKMLREMAAHGENTIEVDVAIAILLETLRQADVPASEVVNIPMREIADLLWMTKKFAYETEWNVAALVDIERRITTIVRYPNPHGGSVERHVSGRLDALFYEGEEMDRGVVVDWKTGWWLPPPSEISEFGFFQQRFYALLVLREWPHLQSVTLREFYPRYSEYREATLFRDQMLEIEDAISAIVERFDRAYERDSWTPSPGKQCAWCARPTACPIFPTAKRTGRISSPEEAEIVAAQVLVAEAAIKQNREALKLWAGEHGPVPVRDAKAGSVMGHRESRRVNRPTREQLERAIEVGESLDDLYRETVHTRFDVHVPRPDASLGPEDENLLERLERSVAQARGRA